MIESNSTDTVIVDEASAPYLGQWNRLVSTTNWEKGRIIHEWRQALIAADAPAAEYADDAWSQRVGNVSGQHVGRLRRVYERFDALRGQLTALYWSHFQAALDWDDAEMWLEGGTQSGWSVAEMRRKRWETLGTVEAERPATDDSASEPVDEDFDVNDASEAQVATAGGASRTVVDEESSAQRHERDSRDSSAADDAPFDGNDEPIDSPPVEPRRPFAHLAEMPDDLGEAFEAFKLAIIRHKFAGWQEIARDDLLAAIDALRELALAPLE